MNKEEVYKFLLENGFTLTDHFVSEYFGDYFHILLTDDFQLRFISSKDNETVDIRSVLDSEVWYDLWLLKTILHKRVRLNSSGLLEDYIQFIYTDFRGIQEAFSSQNYPFTKNVLDDLEKQRVRQMFPGML